MTEMNAAALEDKIKEIVCRMTGMEKEAINSDAHFYRDLGIDSIKGIELTVALQSEFNVQIDDFKIPELTNVHLVAKEINRLLTKQPHG